MRNLPQLLPKWIDTADGVHQILVEPWTWLGVTIPAGFKSDGASSPWWMWWIIPRRGDYVFAAYLHDYLLTVTTREKAAKNFLYALKVLGVSRWKRRMMYRGVRLYDRVKYGQ